MNQSAGVHCICKHEHTHCNSANIAIRITLALGRILEAGVEFATFAELQHKRMS